MHQWKRKRISSDFFSRQENNWTRESMPEGSCQLPCGSNTLEVDANLSKDLIRSLTAFKAHLYKLQTLLIVICVLSIYMVYNVLLSFYYIVPGPPVHLQSLHQHQYIDKYKASAIFTSSQQNKKGCNYIPSYSCPCQYYVCGWNNSSLSHSHKSVAALVARPQSLTKYANNQIMTISDPCRNYACRSLLVGTYSNCNLTA